MKKEKPLFNTKERAILMLIAKRDRFMTTNEIAKAKEVGISWATCQKYLDRLYNDGLIARQFETKKGKRVVEKPMKYKINLKDLYKNIN